MPLGLRGNMAGFLLWVHLVSLRYIGRWEMGITVVIKQALEKLNSSSKEKKST